MKTVAKEIIEKDIDFGAVLHLVRVSSQSEAAGLLHAALRVAFNNGEAFGSDAMAKVAMNTLGKYERPLSTSNQTGRE